MIIPKKIHQGAHIRIIAPSRSMHIISKENIAAATKQLQDMGFTVSFGKHVHEHDILGSAPISSRVADLHDAFSDNAVDAILTVIGGFNSNQLLDHIDYNLITNNPKILCGYSDITALSNAIFAKTGVVGYSGPVFSTFAMQQHNDYFIEYFKKCLMHEEQFTITPAPIWTDDEWYLDQNKRNPTTNEGYWVINKGTAEGTIIGGNLCTLNLLQGTAYMPSMQNSILFLEDDHESKVENFERDLQSLIHLPAFSDVRGIVIGRFQTQSDVTKQKLIHVIKTKKELDHMPVVANADFGHTNPLFTFPIGGTAKITVDDDVAITVVKH